jgi:hypothetical protein
MGVTIVHGPRKERRKRRIIIRNGAKTISLNKLVEKISQKKPRIYVKLLIAM